MNALNFEDEPEDISEGQPDLLSTESTHPMTLDNQTKMALWSTLNALLEYHKVPRLKQCAVVPSGPERIECVQVWWDRFRSELEIEKAYAKCQAEGRTWD